MKIYYDKESDSIIFDNQEWHTYYWLPIDLFVKTKSYRFENVYEGFYHLSKKNWFSEYELMQIKNVVKEIYPNVDLTDSINFVKNKLNG